MAQAPADSEKIILTNEEFIRALKGEDSRFWGDQDSGEPIIIDNRVVIKGRVKITTNFNRNIEISGGVFYSDFTIEDAVFYKVFTISGGVFQGKFEIFSGEFHIGMAIHGGEFEREFNICGGNFHTPFNLFGGIFNGPFSCYGGVFQDYFSIQGAIFQNDFSIHDGEFKTLLDIRRGTFKGDLCISGGEIKRLEIGEVYLPRFQLFSGVWTSHLICAKTQIRELVLGTSDTPLTIVGGGNILLDRCKVKVWWMESFEVHGSFNIKTITPEILDTSHGKTSFLFIKNTDLGQTLFLNVPFVEFDDIVIDGVKLNKITTQNGYFPVPSKKNRLPITTNDEDKAPNPTTMAETYNQLHLAMKAQGQREWEYKYLAAYQEWERKDRKNNTWDNRAALWAQKVSTNYGQSWTRPLGFIMVLGLVFFAAITTAQNGWTWIATNPWDFGRGYLKYLLPTHRFSEIAEIFGATHLTFWALFWDILGRIIIGFLIYQMIAAFRRFGKR